MNILPTRAEAIQSSTSSRHGFHRRDFIKLAADATVVGAVWKPLEAAAAKKLEPMPPGIKVSLPVYTEATDEDLQFAQQLGVSYVNIPTGGRSATLENLIRLKQRVEAAKLKCGEVLIREQAIRFYSINNARVTTAAIHPRI